MSEISRDRGQQGGGYQMFAMKCELGEVPVLVEEGAALDIARQAAVEVQYEQLFAVRADRRANLFVPIVLFQRRNIKLLDQVLLSEVIVDPLTRRPTGFFFRSREENHERKSAVIETWEEDLSGKRTGPTQLVFFPID